MRNSISLYADDLICNFLCQIDLMQRHDDGDALLLCHAAQNREQFQLVADIEERS